MEITIVKGNFEHLKDCVEAVVDSEMGRVYYPTTEIAEEVLLEGFANNEVYVGQDGNFECVGFIWYAPRKMFYKLPYVRTIAVRNKFRGRGIGKKLLSLIETMAFNNYSKLFLTYSDFNERAGKLYEKLGYKEICVIPDLFKEGVAEHVMMKLRE